LADRTFRDAFDLGPFAIVLHWVTPFSDEPPAAPRWLEAGVEDGNVVLRWTPNREPFFYSYEVYRLEGERPVARLSPVPLRAAMWVDTAPSGGSRIYGVRAVSASGILSAMVASPRVTV
jgi:hypothetical protein